MAMDQTDRIGLGVAVGGHVALLGAMVFGLFVLYGFSGYAVYAWRKAKGLQTSVISISTDEIPQLRIPSCGLFAELSPPAVVGHFWGLPRKLLNFGSQHPLRQMRTSYRA